ncbi:MAG: DUF4347 domain-containing protein, partial [Thermoguttaceae bacterium]
MLSVAPPTFLPLNVVLISDAVAQAPQVHDAAANGTIAEIYNADTMTASGLVNLAKSVSAAHGGALIAHLGIVAHGGPGEIDLGNADDLSLATLPSQAAALAQLQSVFTSHAEIDLYSCSVAAGVGGKTFIDEFAADTGAAVFASDNPVGTLPGANLFLDCHTGQAAARSDLFSLRALETIPQLCLLQPAIYSVSPASPVGTGSAQTFTINGSNFQSGCTVTLRDLSLGTTYANRT